MTIPEDLAAELAAAPVTESTEIIAPATASRPSLSTPLMPPPAGLLEGEQRAEDGGVELAPETPIDP